jgi:hypothetical protein
MPSRVKFLVVSTDLRKGNFAYYDLEFSQSIERRRIYSPRRRFRKKFCDYKIHVKNKWWIKFFIKFQFTVFRH